MGNGKLGRYALEFKREAVRLVKSGERIEGTARRLGVVEQTVSNWVKASRGSVGVLGEFCTSCE